MPPNPMSFLVGPTQPVISNSNKSLFFWGEQSTVTKLNIMNGQSLVLYGHPTSSDVEFMLSKKMSFESLSSTSSTRSDAESAPPELEKLFDSLCQLYEEWVVKSGKQFTPQWTMPDLLRFVIGDEAAQNPSLLTDYYYDVVMHGPRSWVCEELMALLDLIN